MRGEVKSMSGKLLLLLVRFYQLCISSVLPPRCIHMPTCSQYMVEAVERHGALRGLWLGLKRFFRCHPFSRGGYDPVP
jgi:putative membrane protein insertion efficiency factor